MRIVSDLQGLLTYPGFTRLFSVRMISQCADGLFQVGLVSLYFFNPANMATVGGVALAFTVLLLPFTIVGPFVGPLLDRWSRQRVLLIGNAIRSGLCLLLAILVYTGTHVVIISVVALLTLGINRFLLSALSAGLPHVVPRNSLLVANTLTPTLGAVSLGVGAAVGLLVNLVAPPGPARDATNLVTAAILLGLAVWAASMLARDELGPDTQPQTTHPIASDAIRDLVEGWKYVSRRGTPGFALTVMAVHRFLYGVNFIALLLISRNLLADPMDVQAGFATFAFLSGVSFIGNGLAIIATPLAHERMRPSRWIVVCLLVSLVSQILLVLTPDRPWIIVAAILMGLGVQGAKIAVDTIVQRDTHDRFRGRTFALYDMMYNAAFVSAAALSALGLPDTGWSRPSFTVLAGIYVCLAIWYALATRKVNDEPRPV